MDHYWWATLSYLGSKCWRAHLECKVKVGPRLPHPRGCTMILSHPLVHLLVSCFSLLFHAVPPLFQRFCPADQFCCPLGYFAISRLALRHVGSEYLLLYHPCTLSFDQALFLSLSPSLPLFFQFATTLRSSSVLCYCPTIVIDYRYHNSPITHTYISIVVCASPTPICAKNHKFVWTHVLFGTFATHL